jgi:hypothetical protein
VFLTRAPPENKPLVVSNEAKQNLPLHNCRGSVTLGTHPSSNETDYRLRSDRRHLDYDGQDEGQAGRTEQKTTRRINQPSLKLRRGRPADFRIGELEDWVPDKDVPESALRFATKDTL